MMTGLPDVQVQNAQPRVEITWPRPDVALFVLDRTLSSGDIDATQLADAARQLVRGITGAAQKR